MKHCKSFFHFIDRSLCQLKEKEDYIFHKLFERSFFHLIGFDYRWCDVDYFEFLNKKMKFYFSKDDYLEIKNIFFSFQRMRRSVIFSNINFFSMRLSLVLNQNFNENDISFFLKVMVFFYFIICYFKCTYENNYPKFNLLMDILSGVMIELITPNSFIEFQFLSFNRCCVQKHCDYEMSFFHKFLNLSNLRKSSFYIFEK